MEILENSSKKETMDLDKLIRENIKTLKPYSSARDEFSGEALVYLDANENPFNKPYNRYPDPLQRKLKVKVSELKQVSVDRIFLGNGSDEPIDLLIRAFCEPGVDNILTFDPTYGMYEVASNINNVEIRKVMLSHDFDPDPEKLLEATDKNSKLIFLCSPNNPTAKSIRRESIIKIVKNFGGLVILDEAYIDFIPESSLLPELGNYPNLVILQTLSKAWGMAGIRLGMAFASPDIIKILNKIKYPYNINILAQKKVLKLLENTAKKDEWVKQILDEKERLVGEIKILPFVKTVFPSDANFFLVRMDNAKAVFEYLIGKKVVVRNRSKVRLCEGCLRITVGTKKEDYILLKTLNELT
jgi:histidinol-phosphate aminotransferase